MKIKRGVFLLLGFSCKRRPTKHKMGGGASRSAIVNGLNSLIVQSFTQSTTLCQSEQEVDQDIEVKCEGTNPLETYEENPACVACFEESLSLQAKQHAMIKSKWRAGNAPVPTSFSQEMTNWYTFLNETCGTRCKRCWYSNFSQVDNFKWKTTCLDSHDIVTTMKNTLQANVMSALTSNQGLADSLMKVLDPSSKENTVAFITNRVMSRVNHTFIQKMLSHMKSQQSIILNNGTSNVVSQQASITSALNFVNNSKVSDTILNEEQWAVQQTLYDDSNTVGDLGQILRDSALGIAQLTQSTFVQVTIMVAVLMMAILAALAITVIVHNAPKI